MAQSNPLNVFRGTDSVAQYFDPDNQPPVPLVEIPDRLNPFRKDNVRIYAKMLTALPAQNVKALPALNMLRHQPKAANKSIVEASSGSTVLSLGMMSRILWGNEDVCAHVTNKKHPDSLRILRFFGLKISLYGGLAQQEPSDPRGIMARLRKLAKKNKNVCYLGQYDNENNWKSHLQWTGPQIFKQLPEINVLCTTVGTGGCITGTAMYLKSRKPSVKVVGVCNVFGDPTPGPRHIPGFESSTFPWRGTIDTFETVSSADSFRTSMHLSREGLIAGPSSGEALHALLSYIGKIKASGKIHDLADSITGDISCVFICCDLPYQYMNSYFQKLGEEEFPPIENQVLLQCDQYPHDERWELETDSGATLLLKEQWKNNSSISICRSPICTCSHQSQKPTKIYDLRSALDFERSHIRGSENIPLQSMPHDAGDPFEDSNLLHARWVEMNQVFAGLDNSAKSRKSVDRTPVTPGRDQTVIVICYDGETARLATSILRKNGYEASSIRGGYKALCPLLTAFETADDSSGSDTTPFATPI